MNKAKPALGTQNPISRAKDFMMREGYLAWKAVCEELPKDMSLGLLSTMLLGQVVITLRQMLENATRGGENFVINSFSLKAGRPQKVVERTNVGRARLVSVWVDSAVGAPDPVFRLGTTQGATSAGGLALTPGVKNEIGVIPASLDLFIASTVDINIYVTEET